MLLPIFSPSTAFPLPIATFSRAASWRHALRGSPSQYALPPHQRPDASAPSKPLCFFLASRHQEYPPCHQTRCLSPGAEAASFLPYFSPSHAIAMPPSMLPSPSPPNAVAVHKDQEPSIESSNDLGLNTELSAGAQPAHRNAVPARSCLKAAGSILCSNAGANGQDSTLEHRCVSDHEFWL